MLSRLGGGSLFEDSLFSGSVTQGKGTAGNTPAPVGKASAIDSLFGDSDDTPSFFDEFTAPPSLKKAAASPSKPAGDVEKDLFSDDMFSFQ